MKFYFIHKSFNNLSSACGLLKINRAKYNLEWSPSEPDILIASERIYNYKPCFDEFLKLRDKAKIVVLFLAEAIEPDLNIADYAIGYPIIDYRERYVRLPVPYTLFDSLIPERVNTLVDASAELTQKKNFCNFIYSNKYSHPRRDELFNIISQYKQVDSLGKHLKNKTISDPGITRTYQLKRPYKFSIAAENASFDGYTSEKIWTSLNAHTVPIYFGNPLIETEINPECFINANSLSNDELINRIKEIDEDDELYKHMILQPWQTSEQKQAYEKEDRDYFEFMDKLLTGQLNKRRGCGCHVDGYCKNFFAREMNLI